MKQTAVEWLVKTLELDTRFNGIMNDVIEQAKAMEKKQVIEAHLDGQTTWDVTSKTAEQYYNETFKSE